MRNILATTGLILLAFIATGCASTKTGKELDREYTQLSSELAAYEPVGDAKIDGLARPFVTEAMQLKDEVDKSNAEWRKNAILQILGPHKPEDCAKAYAKLDDKQRAEVDAAVAMAKKADDSRTSALLSRLIDLGKAGAQLTLEIRNAAGGGSAGAVGLAGSAFNAASGPGGKALDQVTRAIKFGESARAMIQSQIDYVQVAGDAAASNIKKAQS